MTVILVGAFYLTWLLVTCINQTSYKWNRVILGYDLFRLIPVWTFFAPNPGVSDYNLLYRFRLADGTITEFTQVPLKAPHKIGTAVFNPNRRLQKALHDHAQTITIEVASGILTEENKENIKLTFNYISILNYCARLRTVPGTHALQFMILETFGYRELREPRLILNSGFHKI